MDNIYIIPTKDGKKVKVLFEEVEFNSIKELDDVISLADKERENLILAVEKVRAMNSKDDF